MTLALTLGREFVNPRPRDEKHIHNLYCRYMVGSVCYSEGINDDLNKFIWLDQEWNPDTRWSKHSGIRPLFYRLRGGRGHCRRDAVA
jgi:hypothetical protein